MGNTPLISVVVPVYQAEKYLRRGLDSLLQQSDGRWEALCINDGSPDNSDAILEEYARKDPRFRIFSQKNRGVSVSRNRGINEARGEFITFLDADDWLAPDLVARLLKVAEFSEVDIVLFETQLEYEEGMRCNVEMEKTFCLKHSGMQEVNPDSVEEAIGSCCGKAYQRSFLEKNKLFYPVGIRQEDEVFYRCSMACARSIYLLQYKGYHYLQTADSYMHTVSVPYDSYLLYLKGMEIVMDFYREHHCSKEWFLTVIPFLFTQLRYRESQLSKRQMRQLRTQTQGFLEKYHLNVHLAEDYHLRYISELPRWKEFFVCRKYDAEIFGFMGIALVKDRYCDGRFERRVSPWSKLFDTLRKIRGRR